MRWNNIILIFLLPLTALGAAPSTAWEAIGDRYVFIKNNARLYTIEVKFIHNDTLKAVKLAPGETKILGKIGSIDPDIFVTFKPVTRIPFAGALYKTYPLSNQEQTVYSDIKKKNPIGLDADLLITITPGVVGFSEKYAPYTASSYEIPL